MEKLGVRIIDKDEITLDQNLPVVPLVREERVFRTGLLDGMSVFMKPVDPTISEVVIATRLHALGQARFGDNNPFVRTIGVTRIQGEQPYMVMPKYTMELPRIISGLDYQDDGLNIRRSVIDTLINATMVMHEHSLRASDLKPAQVLLDIGGSNSFGGSYLCDFEYVEDVRGERKPYDPIYTPVYASPEVVYRMICYTDPLFPAPDWLKDELLLASDIYALGLIFYELLNSGRMAYGDVLQLNLKEVLEQHLYTIPMPFYHPLSPLIMHMLSKNPNDSPTIAEVREEVNRLWT